MKRRQPNVFNLSFLDIMSCGLGAAVLLFLIITHKTDRTTELSPDLSAETSLLSEEILAGQENLARIRNTISNVDDELAEARGLARQIQDEINRLLGEIDLLGPSAEDEVARIQDQIARLEQQKQALENENSSGNRVRAFVGEGDRQYLTGLKLGGDYVLILVDSSASMLDETIVNVIRRRIRPDDVKLASAKWQQTLSIVDWIVANLDPGTHFQLYSFNETAKAALSGSEGKWLETTDRPNMTLAIDNLNNTIPENGTSLHNAMDVIGSLSPRPDNVFLITDGLPTMAESPRGNTVSGNQRLGFFRAATRDLPRNTPINTLLLPMEGDLLAASAFWGLAVNTRGSFIAPPRDWP